MLGKLGGIVVPAFLNEFASSVNSKKEKMKEKIFKGMPNPLKDSFRKHFNSLWIPLKELAEFASSPHELNITAVDSSVYTNLLSTGGIFYVIRSLAVCRDKTQKRLDTDVIFTKEGLSRIRYFIGRKMELLEFEVALAALKNGFRGDALLLDGSLYGRAVHLLIESKIEEEIVTLLHYFQTYNELLEFCRKENVLLIGVSKGSRSTFYRDYLLKLILDEELRELDIEAGELRKLEAVFSQVLDDERAAFDRFDRLKQTHGEKLDTIAVVLDELASSRPDYQLVMNFSHTIGYTQPMLLGPSARVARFFKKYRLDAEKYVRRSFPNATRKKGDEFVHWAVDIISKIPKMPSIMSFYILLDVRDSPIRIDMPNWTCSLSQVGWPKPVDVNLEDLLKIMVTGYCGLDGYNLWLKNVDEQVRLKRKYVDDIYFPYLEKLFQRKIIRGRGYRRVKYP